MVLTFHGENRTGDAERKHLHENPAIMTIPLIALAVLSVFGGWINVPEAIRNSFLGGFGMLPMSEWLHDWLHPVTASAEAVLAANVGRYSYSAPFGGSELTWALISTVVALVVVLTTSRILSGRPVKTAALDPAPTGFRKVLANKWYVDEFYDRVVVQPIVRISRFLWRIVDSIVIDGTVNMLGNATRAVGWFGSLFQTGQINTYAFLLALGVLVILGVVVL
jgi:NADH-quinone oxidoreductase subunit L